MEKQIKDKIERPAEARIPQMAVSELPEELRVVAGIGASNVLLTLAHHGDLMSTWLEFGMHLISGGRVSIWTRELLILRVGLRTSCAYEWGNHVPGALSAGVTAGEIAALAYGTGSWPAAEAAVLDLVDDLCMDNCASEETWQALTGEIIELVMLIGFYRMNAGFLNSLGVQVEPGRPGLGQGMAYEVPATPVRTAGSSVAEAQIESTADGTWQLKFYHPAATQELRLEAVSEEGALSGSITNEAAGITCLSRRGRYSETV
jgi:4-carboxymuconolactone decarboxylase